LTESHWVDLLTAYFPTASMDSDTARFPGSLNLLDTIASLASISTDLAVAGSALRGIDFVTEAAECYCSAPSTDHSGTPSTAAKYFNTIASY
jgi:hypothetical protein